MSAQRLVHPLTLGTTLAILLLATLVRAAMPYRPGFGAANYGDTDGPLFAGQFAPPRENSPEQFVAVTYNLRYGERLDDMITAFKTVEPFNEADFIFLQEMDEHGVAEAAQALGYDYIYYPASVARDGDNFGNAILSRWPLHDPRKIILPGLHPLTGQQRTATRATAQVGQRSIVLYSVHTEVVSASEQLRGRQAEALLADVPPETGAVIIGGDFNSVTTWGVERLATRFEASGLAHQSSGLGPTFSRFGRRFAATDHIFTRGFTGLAAGAGSDINASDHLPVWTRLMWQQGEGDG